MKQNKYIFTCSTDGTSIDYETVIISPCEPGFWFCEGLAELHNCTFWNIERM